MSKLSYYTRKNKILLCSIAVVSVAILCLLIFRHIHSYGEWELYQEPTCTSYGIERRYCDCGEMQDRRIDTLPHTEGGWEFDEVNSLRKKKCTVCGAVTESESMANHTHDFTEWVSVSEASCTVDGLQIRTCECGLRQENVIKANGHSFGDWRELYSPTCSESGIIVRVCACGQEDFNETDKLDHIQGNWVLNGITKEYPCVNCGEILSSEQLITSTGLKYNGSSVIGIGSCDDKDIVIPNEIDGQIIDSIGKKAFQQNNSIDSIILPNTITSIGSYAFNECSSIKQIHLGSGVTEIGEHAFDSCGNLIEISLPSGLKVLRESTFTYCVSLNKVYIPETVVNIEAMVFYLCSSLTDIYYEGTVDEWNAIIKDEDWNVGIEDYIVHCKNGDIRY